VRNEIGYATDRRPCCSPPRIWEQAIRATQELTLEQEDGLLARALETAIAVSYMRPFTGDGPVDFLRSASQNTGPGSDVHATLEKLRHEVYAHTGKESGRYMFVQAATREGDVVTVEWRESWMPLFARNPPGADPAFPAAAGQVPLRGRVASRSTTRFGRHAMRRLRPECAR
jgi:hypothetical protein